MGGVGKPVAAHPRDVTDRATGRMSRRASPTPGRRAGGLGSGDRASRAASPHGTVRAPATARQTPVRCRSRRGPAGRRRASPGNHLCACRRPRVRDERFILGAYANLPDDEGAGWSGQVEDCAGARPHASRHSGWRSSDAGAKSERPIRMSGGPPQQRRVGPGVAGLRARVDRAGRVRQRKPSFPIHPHGRGSRSRDVRDSRPPPQRAAQASGCAQTATPTLAADPVAMPGAPLRTRFYAS